MSRRRYKIAMHKAHKAQVELFFQDALAGFRDRSIKSVTPRMIRDALIKKAEELIEVPNYIIERDPLNPNNLIVNLA
ncbi:MAG TPA: hypothetical protein VK974_00880 [Methylophilaceae bacterium]|nr:hypothetical protein [Methylophilaceae bacterium]